MFFRAMGVDDGFVPDPLFSHQILSAFWHGGLVGFPSRKRRIKHNPAKRQLYALNHNRNPKGMGGAFRDDHPSNIQATHFWCNEEKGST
jgi:hypothetical protein